MIGWIGNIFIVGGLWGVGNKVRNAFILSIIGESFWIIKSYQAKDWALTSICAIFWLMALRAYIKWGK